MAWIDNLKDVWWLLGVMGAILLALWRLAIRTNKSKEQIDKVQKNEQDIKQLQADMTDIKGDITDIKEGVSKQANDTAAILGALQSIMVSLNDPACNITVARDRFNDYLAHR
jgi:seryl-tRNA synthetase